MSQVRMPSEDRHVQSHRASAGEPSRGRRSPRSFDLSVQFVVEEISLLRPRQTTRVVRCGFGAHGVRRRRKTQKLCCRHHKTLADESSGPVQRLCSHDW